MTGLRAKSSVRQACGKKRRLFAAADPRSHPENGGPCGPCGLWPESGHDGRVVRASTARTVDLDHRPPRRVLCPSLSSSRAISA